jgi:preprotein translocase subunit YajC
VGGTEVLFLLLPIVLLFLLFNGQRKRQRQQAAMQAQVSPGTQICTTSGLFGTVVSVDDRAVVIEAAPGVNLRYDRRAIGLVVPSEEPATGGEETGPAGEPDTPAEPDTPGEPDGHDKPA